VGGETARPILASAAQNAARTAGKSTSGVEPPTPATWLGREAIELQPARPKTTAKMSTPVRRNPGPSVRHKACFLMAPDFARFGQLVALRAVTAGRTVVIEAGRR